MISSKLLKRAKTSDRITFINNRECSANLDWILSSTFHDASQTTIQLEKLDDFQFTLSIPHHIAICHMLSNNKIEQVQILIQSGKLIKNNRFGLLLEDCFVEKHRICHEQNFAFTIAISNITGQLVLVFTYPLAVKEIFRHLKKYSKQNNFLQRYRVKEISFQNFYTIIRKKSRKQLIGQVFNKSGVVCSEQIEILSNYIKILRSEKILNYIPVKAVFDEQHMICVVFEPFSGISMESVLLQKRQINQFDLAAIFYQLILTLIDLQEEEIFHGNINLSNIILTLQHKKNLIYVINSIYANYSNNIEFYQQLVPKYLIAPEIAQENKQPNILSDLYQVGICLAIITFFHDVNIQDEHTIIDSLKTLDTILAKQKLLFSTQQNSSYELLFSYSQLDLIIQLTNSNPNARIGCIEALKHPWFINIKDKQRQLKSPSQGQKFRVNFHLPSLKTIIEIREQSERDLNRSKFVNQLGQDIPSIVTMQKKMSLSLMNELSPFIKPEGQSFSFDVPSIMDNDENVDEEHNVSLLISGLNNPQYNMRPSQFSHCKSSPLQISLPLVFGSKSEISNFN